MSDFEISPTTKASPFIIWTLQRTGGTNLTQRLVDLSGLICTQHEPFNVGRIYGHITQQWLASKDESALAKEIQAITNQQVIKHCLEMVPWEISCALINAALPLNYQHLFLYRENARNRLLSLNFAEKTGVWGPNMQKEATLEKTTDLSIPIDKLVAHERKCVKLMQRAWDYLLSHGAHPLALSYEELYRSPPEQATQKLLPILKALGLSKNKEQDYNFAQEVIGKGDQNTRDKYESMIGLKELEQALLHIPCFTPSINLALHIENITLPGWVLMAQIDEFPSILSAGQSFYLGGVVILDKNAPEDLSLYLTNRKTEINVEWSKPSPKMAKFYPNNSQSACARFKSVEICMNHEDIFTLAIKGPDTYYPLFDISLA